MSRILLSKKIKRDRMKEKILFNINRRIYKDIECFSILLGLECLLPPPPPPPPVALSTSEGDAETSEIQQLQSPGPEDTAAGTCTAVSPSQFTVTATSPFFIHPGVQAQSSTPWWVPTEADSLELYDSQYAQWYEATYKVPPPANILSKVKSKYYKRKSEFIDPAQDAGELWPSLIIYIVYINRLKRF